MSAWLGAEGTADIQSKGEEVKVLFKIFDEDGNGSITMDEMKEVLKRLDPVSWTDEKVQKVFGGYDADGDGDIQFTEFWSWICGHGQKSSSEDLEPMIANAKAEDKARREAGMARMEAAQQKRAAEEQKQQEKDRLNAERAAGTRLTRKQFIEKQMGVGMSREQANELFTQGDQNNDGDLDEEELGWLVGDNLATVAQVKATFEKGSDDEGLRAIVQAFAAWDKDGSGCISNEELTKTLQTLNPRFTSKTVNVMMEEADADKNGFIDILEFVTWLSGKKKKRKMKKKAKAKLNAKLQKMLDEERQ
mmetsp:Transcript_107778/g.230098  ORF Transcript_107778/g.230098 Transcript_107778/m.230098 type:complete len:305 (+) Transcript_107778:94-1008(+)